MDEGKSDMVVGQEEYIEETAYYTAGIPMGASPRGIGGETRESHCKAGV